MAQLRKITIVTTARIKPIELVSQIQNLKQLKEEVEREGISLNNTMFIERSTKAEYVLDEAILPQTDFTMFLMPKEVKSGGRKRLLKVIHQVLTLKGKELKELEKHLNKKEVLNEEEVNEHNARLLDELRELKELNK